MRLVLTALLLSVAYAATATAEDLLRVYQDALDNDPQIREANATRRATREARPQAWAALLPQIDGTVQATHSESDETVPFQTIDTNGVITIIPVPRLDNADTTVTRCSCARASFPGPTG